MNLVELCTRFALRTGLPTSTTVFGGGSTLAQVAALLDEVLDYLTSEYSFQNLREEAVFTGTAVELQGTIAALASNGFSRLCSDTFFDRTERLAVQGPLTEVDWQAMKATTLTGPATWFRIRGDNLYLTPPQPGHQFAFEYMSNFAVRERTSGVRKRYATLDSDEFLLSDDLLLAGLRWRWKAEKGLDYAEELRQFEILARSKAMTSGGARAYSLDGCGAKAVPGIIVPSGNWSLP
jgi:hypothetical protein